MLAIEIEFLTGRYVATARGDRHSPEWPPHPARLFAALAAAWGERDSDDAERAALSWMETLGAPHLCLPPHFPRQTVTTFVPVNDSNDQEKKGTPFQPAAQGIDVRRNRQGRTFPSVSLPERQGVVLFIWPNADEQEMAPHRDALIRLLGNVTYLGHSSSLVRVSIHDGSAEPTHQPLSVREEDDAAFTIRVAGPGRLAALEQAHQLSLKVGRRIEPPPGAFQRYAPTGLPTTSAANTVFEQAIVFRRASGPAIPLRAALMVTTRAREALMSVSPQTPPEELSGHAADGSPSQSPHLAFIPLAFLDHRYADGNLRGLAVVLPAGLEGEARQTVLTALGRLTLLKFGREGVWQLERVKASGSIESLRAEPYVGPAKEWATVTPVIFGRFPKKLYGEEAQRMVREHCVMIGLPEPRRVDLMEVSPVRGVPPSTHFATLSTKGKVIDVLFANGRHRLPAPQGDRRPRLRVHAVLTFDRPVRGPILLGAGRYLGMGLCRAIGGRH